MFDHQKIDSYFNQNPATPANKPHNAENRHTRMVRFAKLFLPGAAAILISLLLIIPAIRQGEYDIKLDITKPKAGEMEKLHMENTIFNITGADNKVQNFTADNIDETTPGSKIIKLINPEGTLPSGISDWVNVKSPTGFYNQNDNTLQLTDNVDIFYSGGMNVNVFDLAFDFNAKYGHSRSPVSGQGLFGDIQSEGFDFYSDQSLLVFTGHTHLKIREESFKTRNQ